MPNPILIQRMLKATMAAQPQKKAPPPAPILAPVVEAPTAPEPPARAGLTPGERLETLPDTDLHAKAKALLGDAYKPTWSRDQVKAKLLAAGCVG